MIHMKRSQIKFCILFCLIFMNSDSYQTDFWSGDCGVGIFCFVMRATSEFHLALGIYVKNALKIVVCLLPLLHPKKSNPKRNLMEPFQGSFLGAKCYLKRDENN